MARIWVAMSGGVDSSVAAALLLDEGHDLVGVTMRLWPAAADGAGGSTTVVDRARRACGVLGIEHRILDHSEAFERKVLSYFAREYAAGRTPNPCVACNDHVKFGGLLQAALSDGADALATGHYARVVADEAGHVALARGLDPKKDQSYFLYRLTGERIRHIMFPLGEFTKEQVRGIAATRGLPNADDDESQDACFAQGGSHFDAVRDRIPSAFVHGDIVDESGTVLGHHEGIARYTIGQRKGLGIGGLSEPLRVVAIDSANNRVVVGAGDSSRITAVSCEDAVWAGPSDIRVLATVRYRAEPVPALARRSGEQLDVLIDAPLDGVAPGQALVCYRGDVVIGGGTISCAT